MSRKNDDPHVAINIEASPGAIAAGRDVHVNQAPDPDVSVSGSPSLNTEHPGGFISLIPLDVVGRPSELRVDVVVPGLCGFGLFDQGKSMVMAGPSNRQGDHAYDTLYDPSRHINAQIITEKELDPQELRIRYLAS